MGLFFYYSCICYKCFTSSIIKNHSPYQLLFKREPDYHFYKIFGCACYLLLRPYNQHKMSFRSSLCVFLCYASNHKGYLCLSPTGHMYITRHVIFDENVYPYALSSNPFSFVSSNTPSSSISTPILTIFQHSSSSDIQHTNDEHLSLSSNTQQHHVEPFSSSSSASISIPLHLLQHRLAYPLT